MKLIILSLILTALSGTCFANSANEVFSINPTLTIGVGVEMKTGFNQPNLAALFVKGYLFDVSDTELGVKFLGAGMSVNDHGETGLVVSPVSFCLKKNCLSPDFIFPNSTTTNFGISLSRSF